MLYQLDRSACQACQARSSCGVEEAGSRRVQKAGTPCPARPAVGGRLRQGHLWELVRRLARTAGIGSWEQPSPHSLRQSAITFALDAGSSLGSP